MIKKKGRAGTYKRMKGGFSAFIPAKLPPNPPIQYDNVLRDLLSRADRAIARLDGVLGVLPNPELFVAMFVKKEAVLSSQIEGTQASLQGVLEFEANLIPSEDIKEIKEVVRYVEAIDKGMKMLKTLGRFTIDLIKELHYTLIKGTRGSSKSPGNFRTSQNWIGTPGIGIKKATFVPPPPERVPELMEQLIDFIEGDEDIPPLIKAGLIHVQFESIHPFLDGNGRLGRMLITLFLYKENILNYPILYLSYYLKKNKRKYYNSLMKVRNKGDWEQWLKFFLKGVIETAEQSTASAKRIIALKEEIEKRLSENKVFSVYALDLLKLLFEIPIIHTGDIRKRLGISRETANQLIKLFNRLGIVKPIPGKKRYIRYVFEDYINIIKEGVD